MIFRQLFDPPTATFTYLLADEHTRDALLIDCVFEQHARDAALVRELGLNLTMTLETHVHADHVTGAWLMKQALGSGIAASAAGEAQGLDLPLADRDELSVGSLRFQVRATPGHTAGCVSYYCEAEKVVFTGDALLIRGAGRTDFQQGSARQLFASVRDQLFTLPDDVTVYPGHDYSGRTSTTIAEEKHHNPRLGERVRELDFVGYMDNLGLPHPKQLDVALPANLRSGQPEQQGPLEADWGPVVRTYAGVLQVEPEWVRTHRNEVVVVDVRENAEIEASPLGSIEGSRIVPLSELRDRVESISSTLPVIVACPSGARSAMAATILEKAGIERVANLRGGLLEWQSLGFPLKRAEI